MYNQTIQHDKTTQHLCPGIFHILYDILNNLLVDVQVQISYITYRDFIKIAPLIIEEKINMKK